MFYQSPFATPAAAPAAPPAFNEVSQALRQETAGNTFAYLVETRKLCLAVCSAEEVATAMRSASPGFDPKKIFHQELQNQILAFALMRILPENVLKNCIQAAATEVPGAPPSSSAGRLARELESAAGEDEQMVAAVQEALVAQPLFRLASQQPEIFKALEETYEQCASYANQLMGSLRASMSMLANTAGNPASLPQQPANASPTWTQSLGNSAAATQSTWSANSTRPASAPVSQDGASAAAGGASATASENAEAGASSPTSPAPPTA